MPNDKDVICLATGSTYDIVTMTAVTAHPAVAPYPRKEFPFLVPIKKGGYMEKLYNVQAIVECLPSMIQEQKGTLAPEQFARLEQYHYLRSKSFGYGRSNALKSPAVQSFVSDTKSGMAASQVNISQEKMKLFVIPLPPYREQDRIAKALDRVLPELVI